MQHCKIEALTTNMSKMKLHVWGKGTEVSIIEPECLAAAWLLSIHLLPQNVDFEIVTSNNTNIGTTGRLPVLIDNNGNKHETFYSIASFISNQYPTENTKFVPDQKLSDQDQFINLMLMSYLDTSFKFIHQYNLYVCTANYELYTRKLFGQYLPFPMMYRQPNRLHEIACEQVRHIGIGINRSGLLQLGSSEVYEDEDEDDLDANDKVAVSALHEKVLLAKKKGKFALKEARNSLKCLHLLGEQASHIQSLFTELNPDSPVQYAHMFRAKKVSSSELLLYSYIACMTSLELPDQFVARFMEAKFPALWTFSQTISMALNSTLLIDKFRAPIGAEVPSLWNEAGRLAGMIQY